MYRVGIIGLGHVAIHHVAAIESSEEFRLVAGCDPDKARHGILGKGIATYTRSDTMLERDDLDVVVVASPNRLHAFHAVEVMSSGRWAFVEKPLVRTQEDFDELGKQKQALGGKCALALHAAFAVDVEWYLEHGREHGIEFRRTGGISATFCDPYIDDDKVLEHGPTSWGSWMDSGINALSVIGRLSSIESLHITDCHKLFESGGGTRSINAEVRFEYELGGDRKPGLIATDWTRGIDRKVTVLHFPEINRELLLDHSAQRVALRAGSDEKVLYTCTNGLPRLTNHYIGAFRDLARQMQSGEDNFKYASSLHSLVFDAESWQES